MIVITGCQKIGTLLLNNEIFQATSFQILPISRNTSILSDKQLEDEQRYIHLLESHLKDNAFYFSYKYNITLSIQKQVELVANGCNNWRKVKYRTKRNKSLFYIRRRTYGSFGIDTCAVN